MYPAGLKYSRDHFWVKDEGNGRVRIGITYHYKEQLQKIIFIELPKAGAGIKSGEPFGSIESSKTISDMISPVTGKVIEINSALQDKPDLISKEPYDSGWLVVMKMSDPQEINSLMSAADYEALVSK